MKRIKQIIRLASAGSGASPVKRRMRLLINVVFGVLAPCAAATAQVPTWQMAYRYPQPYYVGELWAPYDNGAATGPNGKVYIVGGYSSNSGLATVTQRWDPLNPVPILPQVKGLNTPRAGLATVTGCDGKIYAIGGFDSTSTALRTVEAYDTTGNTWTTQTAKMNNPHGNLAATVGKDCRIWVITNDADPNTGANQVEILDGAWTSGQWNYTTWETPGMSLPLFDPYIYAAVTDYTGNIYALGEWDLYEYAANVWTDCSMGTCNNNPNPQIAYPNNGIRNYAATLGGDGNIYLVEYQALSTDQLPGLNGPTNWTPIVAGAGFNCGGCPLPHPQKFAMTTAEGQMLVVGGDSTNVSGPAVDSYGPMPANLGPYEDWWKFDGTVFGDGDSARDQGCTPITESGNAIYAPGRVSGALSLNGATNLSFGGPLAQQCGDIGGGDFSIEFWINPSSSVAGVVESILDKRTYSPGGSILRSSPASTGSYSGYQVFLDYGEIGFQMDNGSFQNYGSSVAIPLHQWTHVAITVARQANERSMGTIWVNGVMAAQFAPMTGSLTSPAILNIGVDNLGDRQYYTGLLDELTIYTRALSFAEVRSVFMAGAAGKTETLKP